MTFEPTGIGDEDDETVHTSSFWDDLNRRTDSPRFRRSYEKQTQRLAEAADAPQRPRGDFWRRFWRSLTGQRDVADTCRPVTVTGDDGQPVHTRVLGAEPMSEAGQAALGEIVRATQRRFVDSQSPWSQWLTDQLLDHEWTSSGLVEASGHVFDLKQVSRWLHSQDVPEPWAAVLVAKAFGASVVEALRAAEHGVLVDAVLEEAGHEQLRPEYGIRATFTSTREAEAAIGDDRDEAEARAAKLAARNDVVSAMPLRRKVTDWEELKDGDRG